MTINERIKHLRKKELHLTQDEMAAKLRISRSNLACIETEKTNATDRVINDICREYGVNREWLEKGEGGEENIFIKTTPFERAYNRFGYLIENSTPSKKAALAMILELLYTVPDEQWDMIMSHYENYKKAVEEEGKQ